MKKAELTEGEIASIAVDAMIEVHRELGPGLLESSYEHCLLYELVDRGLMVERQVPLPLRYKETELEIGYRIDLWVERKVIIELKAVEALHPVHLAQMITYLKLSNNRLGLLVNFNEKLVHQGIRRVANKLAE